MGSYETYNIVITAHGILMIFFMVMPVLIGGFGKSSKRNLIIYLKVSRSKILTNNNKRYYSSSSNPIRDLKQNPLNVFYYKDMNLYPKKQDYVLLEMCKFFVNENKNKDEYKLSHMQGIGNPIFFNESFNKCTPQELKFIINFIPIIESNPNMNFHQKYILLSTLSKGEIPLDFNSNEYRLLFYTFRTMLNIFKEPNDIKYVKQNLGKYLANTEDTVVYTENSKIPYNICAEKDIPKDGSLKEGFQYSVHNKESFLGIISSKWTYQFRIKPQLKLKKREEMKQREEILKNVEPQEAEKLMEKFELESFKRLLNNKMQPGYDPNNVNFILEFDEPEWVKDLNLKSQINNNIIESSYQLPLFIPGTVIYEWLYQLFRNFLFLLFNPLARLIFFMRFPIQYSYQVEKQEILVSKIYLYRYNIYIFIYYLLKIQIIFLLNKFI